MSNPLQEGFINLDVSMNISSNDLSGILTSPVELRNTNSDETL